MKKRLQFDFTEDALALLDKLKDKADLTSRAEAVRKALKLYDFIYDKTQEGYSINLLKDKQTLTLALL